MGFRSTLVSEDFGQVAPDWFIEKYDWLSFSSWNGKTCIGISSVNERKFYAEFENTELFIDLQRVLKELKMKSVYTVVLLHECGGITLVKISQDEIYGREPLTWKEVKGVEHDYCYGCSDLPEEKDPN